MPYGKVAQKRLYDKNKAKIIEYLGGSCVCCSDTENLEFDHIDPEQKEFTLGGSLKSKSIARLLVEADKCQLLCKDCHKHKHEIADRKPLVMSPDHLFFI